MKLENFYRLENFENPEIHPLYLMLLFHGFKELLCILKWFICTQEITFVPHHSGFHLWVNVFLSDIQHSKYEQVPRHHKSEWIHMTGMLTDAIKLLCTVCGCAACFHFGSHMLYKGTQKINRC